MIHSFYEHRHHLRFRRLCAYEITKSEDGNEFVKQDFDLECKIKPNDGICANKWKNCTWVRSSDNMRCFLHHVSDKVRSSCDNAMKHVKVNEDFTNVDKGVCRIRITSPDHPDDGNWTCFVEPCMDKDNCHKGTQQYYIANIHVNVSTRYNCIVYQR